MKFYFYKNNRVNLNKVFETFKQSLREFLLEQDAIVDITKLKKDPTNKMRGYYFGVVVAMVKVELYNLGNDMYSVNDVHDILKEENFFYEYIHIKTKNGMVKTKVYKSISNKDGDRKESLAYIDACIRWAAEFLNITIPEPNEYGIELEIKGE